MLEDFKQSVDKIFRERLSSPLFGAFAFSWAVWNWKVVYFTIFVSESKIKETKLEYITTHFRNINHQLWFPILSTLFIVLIYPFVSTGAFWISLKFSKWNTDLKNMEENTRLLSLEQSIQLRQAIREQEDVFEKLFKKKDDEIEELKKEVEVYKSQIESQSETISKLPVDTKEELYRKEYQSLKSKPELYKQFTLIGPRALKEITMFNEGSSIDRKLFDFFLVNDYIVRTASGIYKLTEKGKYIHRQFIDENLLKNNN